MKKLVELILGRPEPSSERPGRGDQSVAHVQPFLPAGRRLYCIGDIHGRLDLLEELHGMILVDSDGFEGSKGVVYLGDFIDRGGQSKQVVDLLIEHPLKGFDTVHLLGNHEQAMLDFLAHPRSAVAWLNFGGQVTLMSYGAGLGRVPNLQEIEVLRDELEEKLPPGHLSFLSNCRLFHIEGSYCFVHAGIRPGIGLSAQSAQDLLWIREEFTRSLSAHDYIVVHGHSISNEVEWLPNRIGIDTGAYYSGLLTALVLEGDQQRLLQTGRGSGAG